MSRLLMLLPSLAAGVFAASAALAAWQTGMQEPASEMAAIQRDLNVFVMWIIVVIGALVFGVMFYSIIRHRKSRGHKAAHFHENTVVEIIWTTVPMLIIIGMAYPATKAILFYKDTASPEMTIKVTGYQWKWSYDYLDEDGISFYSQLSTPPEQIGGKYFSADAPPTAEKSDNYLLEVDNEMVVPVGKKVRLLLTAADVIHAWWVPQLGVKQDAVPGTVRDAWFLAERTGVYRGQCAELCGKNHGFMPVVVRVVSEEDYAEWAAARGGGGEPAQPLRVGQVSAAAEEETPAEWTMESAMKQGEEAYQTYCAACHQANGKGLAPAFPSLVGADSVKGEAAAHIGIVLGGREGTAMAAFSYLSNADVAAIVTYERNAWGNNTGDLVHPDDVRQLR